MEFEIWIKKRKWLQFPNSSLFIFIFNFNFIFCIHWIRESNNEKRKQKTFSILVLGRKSFSIGIYITIASNLLMLVALHVHFISYLSTAVHSFSNSWTFVLPSSRFCYSTFTIYHSTVVPRFVFSSSNFFLFLLVRFSFCQLIPIMSSHFNDSWR